MARLIFDILLICGLLLLGWSVVALAWQSGSVLIALKLMLIWLLVMGTGAVSHQLITQYALRGGKR